MDRVRKIEEALKTKEMRNQTVEWEKQKTFLRDTLRELWSDGLEFKSWWKNSSHEVKMALVLTAIDDFPSTPSFGAVVFAVCEELLDEENLVINEGIEVINLMEKLMIESENSNQSFLMDDENENQGIKFPESLKRTLATARSCILLQFAMAILLIFQNEKSSKS
jgi:hypothetical protein